MSWGPMRKPVKPCYRPRKPSKAMGCGISISPATKRCWDIENAREHVQRALQQDPCLRHMAEQNTNLAPLLRSVS